MGGRNVCFLCKRGIDGIEGMFVECGFEVFQ